MSKQVRRSGQSVQSHQPGWMAHWMRTSSNATAETASEAPRSVKDSGKLEAKTGSVRMSSEGFRNEGMCSGHGGIQGVEGTSMKHLSAHDSVSSTSMERCVGVGVSTRLVPYHDLERYRLDKGKAVVTPPVKRPSIFSSNQLHDHGWKPHLRLEGEMGNQSDPHGKDWLQKMQKCSHVISLLPTKPSDKNEHKVPSCLHETMRICTTVEAPPRGACPWFSQTTHSVLITKNTDANVSKEADIFRSLVTKMSGNSTSVLECVQPFYSQANRGGVTLQPISSSNSGDTGIGASKYGSKNESSAETDTMDMDFSQEKGANSARSTKVFSFGNNPSPRMDAASSREVVGCRWMSSGLPEINLELPASSSEDIPTSSRTQSLEMDMLLVQAEQPEHEPKSNPYPDDSPKADPTTRWVKRLKLSSSETSALGSKSSKLAEKLSRDKRRDFFRSILKRGITREQHGEGEHLPPDKPRKSKELLLSHVWIKRWLRNGSQISQRKPETLVVCEPQSLKPSKDELPKKQFPSIAAMALMGRTMSGFQSCELQKRGSFTIWNTNTL